MISFVGNWRFFKKLGYKGWVSLIPFYSTFCLLETLFGNGWMMLLPFAAYFVFLLFAAVFANLSVVLVFLLFMVYIGFMIWYVISIATRLAHSFGKSGWWTVGTFFFGPIMHVVYGLSDLRFRNRYYPYMENYDAIDGFIDFFRNQRPNVQANDDEKHCSHCGAPLRENTAFCTTCGAKIEE